MKKLALLALALAGAACGGGDTASSPSPAPKDAFATTWRLQTIEPAGGAVVAVSTPERYTLRLETTGFASVRADCNSCGGPYSLSGPRLTLDRMACTLVGCPPDSLDAAYLGLLYGETEISADGSRLTLTSSRGVLRYAR